MYHLFLIIAQKDACSKIGPQGEDYLSDYKTSVAYSGLLSRYKISGSKSISSFQHAVPLTVFT